MAHLPGTFLVTAADAETVRGVTHELYQKYHPELIEHPHHWFPDRLSPTGQLPATHFFCWYPNMTDVLWEEFTAPWMAAAYAAKGVSVIGKRAAPGQTKAQFLASLGLQVIESK